MYPILVHTTNEKKENTGSQMGHTKKTFKRKDILSAANCHWRFMSTGNNAEPNFPQILKIKVSFVKLKLITRFPIHPVIIYN